eukprot:302437-Rhodomonas_salina.1
MQCFRLHRRGQCVRGCYKWRHALKSTPAAHPFMEAPQPVWAAAHPFMEAVHPFMAAPHPFMGAVADACERGPGQRSSS